MKPKIRSEFETEMIINKWRAVARKRQIQLLKDELHLHEPLNTLTYTLPEHRKPFLKALGRYLLELPRQFLP